MTKSTMTLSQSGLLAVLLQRQRYKVSQLAWHRAHRKHVRAAFCNTLTWVRRALRAHKKSEAVMNCSCAGCRSYWQTL
jgi:hypothetical protein